MVIETWLILSMIVHFVISTFSYNLFCLDLDKMGTSLRGTLFIAIILSVLPAYHADVCCFPSQFEGHIIDMEPTGNQNEPYTQVCKVDFCCQVLN
jgi:hypothetical protein